MGNTGQGQVKPTPDCKNNESTNPPDKKGKGNALSRLYSPGLKRLRQRPTCCGWCCRILFVTLTLVVVIKSIAVIAVAVSTALATKIYSSDISGRMVAMIVLAVTAAASLCMGIYAIVAMFKRNTKALHTASVVLILLAVIQAVIVGVAVKVTEEDEVNLSRSLAESFRLAQDDNPRHIKIWAMTQNELNCCGVYSAHDYRNPRLPLYFPPDVPISCCPNYDPDRSDLVQERDREICKAKKEYYDMGCKGFVIEVFKETAALVLGVTVSLIILEVFVSIIGSCLSKEKDLLVMVSPVDAEAQVQVVEIGRAGDRQSQISKTETK